jgi:ribose transport system substrate-binding protein
MESEKLRDLAKRGLVVSLLLVAAAIALAACGGGSSSTSSSGGSEGQTTSSGTEGEGAGGENENEGQEEGGETGAELAPEPTSTEPTSIISGLEPFSKPPPKGVTAVNLQCDFPTCETISKPIREMGKKLGWNVKTIVFKTGAPQEAVTQAVNAPGVEFIFTAGIQRPIIEPQIKVAEEKGIAIISASNPEPPKGEVWPVAIAEQYGAAPATDVTHWIINQSEGKANILLLDYQEVPITATEKPAIEKTLEEECPECSFSDLVLTGEELAAGSVPAKVVAYLQAHPEIDYIHVAFGNILLGVPEALKTAGLLENVTITSMNGLETAEGEMLKRGEVAAFYVGGQTEYALMEVDAAARLAAGMKLPQKTYEEAPQHWMCFPETAEKCTNWNGPQNQEKEFEELWGLK